MWKMKSKMKVVMNDFSFLCDFLAAISLFGVLLYADAGEVASSVSI